MDSVVRLVSGLPPGDCVVVETPEAEVVLELLEVVVLEVVVLEVVVLELLEVELLELLELLTPP